MNTKFFRVLAFAVITLLAIVSVFFASRKDFNNVQAEKPVPTMIARVIYDIPTRFPVWSLNEDAHYTGPVSKTCIDRTLFQYHNIDRASCGILATLTKVAKDIVEAVTSTPDITTTKTATPTTTPIIITTNTSTPDTSTQTPPPTGTPEPSVTPDTSKTPKPTDVATKTPKATKTPCNKGGGDGSDGDKTDGDGAEGCDPGKNPDKGNDDETTSTPAPTQQSAAGLVIYAVYALVSKGYWKRIGVGPASDQLRGIALIAKGNKLEVKVEIVK